VISKAYQVLYNSEEREKYNKKREVYREKGLIDPLDLWKAEFNPNASGTDTGESDSDDSEGEKENKPDRFRKNIYKEATPFIQNVLRDPDDSTSKEQIQILNKRITKQNQREGFRKDDFHINLRVLESIGRLAQDAAASVKQDPNDKEAGKEFQKLEKQLEKWVRVNSYAPEWLVFQNDEPEKGEPSSSKKKDKGKGREGESSSSKKNNKDKKNKKRDPTSSIGNELSKTKVDWKPGETRKGEKILGYRPFEKTNYATGKKSVNGYQFIIEKEGQPNPIALVSGEDIGRQALRAYIRLPERQKKDIRYSEKRYTWDDEEEFDELIENFDKILGFACKPFKTKTEGSNAKYPDGYALQSFKDGSQDIVSRQCLRNVFGRKDADNQITEFYEDIDETPPWLIEPEAIFKKKSKRLTHGWEAKRRRKSRRRDEESQSDSDSDSDASSMFVSRRRTKRPARRRTRSDESSDEESDDSSSDRRRRSRKAKHPARRHARSDESSDEESDDSSSDRRRQSRKAKAKGKPKLKGQPELDPFTDMMQNFMKQMTQENKRQAQNLAKGLEKVLRRKN
jgi:hypothetical protein